MVAKSSEQDYEGQIWAPTLPIKIDDLSVSNESPCQETSPFQISAHLDMSMKNGEGVTF